MVWDRNWGPTEEEREGWCLWIDVEAPGSASVEAALDEDVANFAFVWRGYYMGMAGWRNLFNPYPHQKPIFRTPFIQK